MEYKLIRSRRKTLGLEISKGEVIVRAPLLCPKREIERFILSREDWIRPRLAEWRAQRERAAEAPLSEAEIGKLKKEARAFFSARCEHFAGLLGIEYSGVTVRCQKTRWGSCSRGGRLSFNCLLMLAPREVADSVVLHELCHIKHFDHSKAFYADILRVMPDYREREAWLKTEGRILLLRASGTEH